MKRPGFCVAILIVILVVVAAVVGLIVIAANAIPKQDARKGQNPEPHVQTISEIRIDPIERIEPQLGLADDPPQGNGLPAKHWVREHKRDGHDVKGHWAKNPRAH